ncbi:helix-turn-helix domain-containing protein [Candidatus Collierbacteria bacterium]|nr:helix-turn-helix domain-containing protein [Candidatus Collierbacteria bacterium]
MKTAGEILKAGRKEKGWTISELSKRTKIQERFIEALENSDLAKLPAMPFVNGFLRTISSELDLKPEGMVAIFRRDFGEDDKGKVIPNSLEKKDKGFRWAPSTSVVIGVLAMISVFGFYLIIQLKGLLGVPSLEIFQPQEQAIVGLEIVVEGRTDPTASVSINGQKIKKNRNGTFSQTIGLSEGAQTVAISATGQNGKTTEAVRNVQVKK